MGFLLLHRNDRELLAAASFFTEEHEKHGDINMLELKAFQMAIGLMVMVCAGAAEELTRICACNCTRSELRTLVIPQFRITLKFHNNRNN